MTPLIPVPGAPQALPSGRGSGQRPANDDAGPDLFATTLEQERTAVQNQGDNNGAGTTGQHCDDADSTDTDAAQAAAAAGAIPLLPPAPPWPPPGLAGLALSKAAGHSPTELNGAVPVTPGDAAAAQLSSMPPAAGEGDGTLESARALLAAGTTGSGAAAGLPIDTAEAGTEVFALPSLPPDPGQATGPRQPAPLLATPLPTPDLRNADFSERFSAQLQWMAGQNIGHARINISPQDLGPVEVLLHLDGDRISADFISAHADTRQALEQGLPRLRDLLGQHGFQLAHAGVGSESSDSSDGTDNRAAAEGADGTDDPSSTTHVAAPVRIARGLVDAYA
ncbi:flagellar hook-length control protein FliK [Luteimonas sp. A478]